MNTLPTAKEFFNDRSDELNSNKEDIPQWMIKTSIEFAKLYVEAQREAILKNIKVSNGGTWKTNEGYLQSDPAKVNKESILNAYPLTLIK